VFLPEILHPFPLAALDAWRKDLSTAWTLELSYQRQFHHYLGSLTDLGGVRSAARSGGLPLSTAELSRLLTEASS
jgi:hypothetical protein